MDKKGSNFDFSVEEAERGGQGGFDPEQIRGETKTRRGRVPFSTQLNAGFYEKLQVIKRMEGKQINELADEAIGALIESRERERGAPYEVPSLLRIDESKRGS